MSAMYFEVLSGGFDHHELSEDAPWIASKRQFDALITGSFHIGTFFFPWILISGQAGDDDILSICHTSVSFHDDPNEMCKYFSPLNQPPHTS